MSIINDDAFRAWEAAEGKAIADDPVWRLHAYRVALYLVDESAKDLKQLKRLQPRGLLADQLQRAMASIGANIGEGMAKATVPDRSRYIGHALGSLRESQTWYRAARAALPVELCKVRDEQLSELRALLLGYQRWLARLPEGHRLM